MKPIRSILCLLVALTFLIGCSEEAAPPQKAAVVSKKIDPNPPAKPSDSVANAKQDNAAVIPKADTTAAKDATNKADDQEVKKHTAELLASVQQEEATAERSGSYNSKGKPNPFAPLFRDEPEQATVSAPVVARSKRKKRIPTTPLEKVDLSQLKLVATVRSHNGNSALVEDASGKGFIVKKGTYIGINAGSVVQIVKDRIIVEEEIETLLGEISLQKRELKLQKPPGE